MKNFVFSSLLFICAVSAIAQKSPAILKGKVTAEVSDLQGIYVINSNSEQSSITAAGGYFEIAASVGDTLMFSSTLLVAKRIAISDEDLSGELLFIRMEMLINRLDEVIVKQYHNITAESLGIVPKGQRIYTPAERKLNAASNPYAQIGLSSAASLDPVLNWISGRTAMLKKEAEVEKKESWLEILSNMYSGDYLTKLKIPSEYIGGFFRYCVDNTHFVATLKAKNKTMAAFQLAELAVKYNEIVALESK